LPPRLNQPQLAQQKPMAFHPTHFLILVAVALAGCVTQPLVLDASHPASIEASEASSPPARATLRPDADTLRTRELLAQRAQEAKDAEAEAPVDTLNPSPSAPRTAPGPLKGKDGHEHH
jgi:hypothetical protein